MHRTTKEPSLIELVGTEVPRSVSGDARHTPYLREPSLPLKTKAHVVGSHTDPSAVSTPARRGEQNMETLSRDASLTGGNWDKGRRSPLGLPKNIKKLSIKALPILPRWAQQSRSLFLAPGHQTFNQQRIHLIFTRAVIFAKRFLVRCYEEKITYPNNVQRITF